MSGHRLIVAGVLASFLAAATAGSAGEAPKGVKFRHADQNKDGQIDGKEWKAEKNFEKRHDAKVNTPLEAKADRNKDGVVGPAEKEWIIGKGYLKHKSKVDTDWEKKADLDGNGVVDAAELFAFRHKMMDANGDGIVDEKERAEFWKSFRAKVTNEIEKKYDADGDGFLNAEEAQEMLRDRMRVVQTDRKAKADTEVEREYDADGDGVISADEARAVLDAVGQ